MLYKVDYTFQFDLTKYTIFPHFLIYTNSNKLKISMTFIKSETYILFSIFTLNIANGQLEGTLSFYYQVSGYLTPVNLFLTNTSLTYETLISYIVTHYNNLYS